jgi:hypothetical protein
LAYLAKPGIFGRERPEGGSDFFVPSIAAGWPLEVDPRWSGLLNNVRHRFGMPG